MNWTPKYISWLSKSSFIFILFISSILGISMNSFLLTWSFMEINLMAFVPLISLEKKMNPHMLGMKYFLIQALGSIFLLISYLYTVNFNNIFNLFLFMSILWKMGFPPFHFWFFSLSMDLNWMMFLILSTWQKILPLFILSKLYLQNWEFMILLSLLIVISGSLFQVSIKKLMIFSSIFTATWILTSMLYYIFMWFYMLFIYSMLLIMFISFLTINSFELKESQNYYTLNLNMKIIQFFILLTMAGIPPFVGFYMKTMILVSLTLNNSNILLLILVISSIFMIYMYTSLFLMSLSMYNTNNKMLFNFYSMSSFLLFMFFIFYSPMLFLIM